MPPLQMVYAPDPRLKKRCTEVSEISEDLKQLASDMLDSMYQQHGLGLAAPQIGSDVRVFVMDCEQGQDEEIEEPQPGKPYKIFNPVITKASDEVSEYEEGCLSLPNVLQKVERPAKVTLEYLDENGKKQVLEAEGLMATCIQHELDHLNGILLLDHMMPVKRQMTLKKLKKWKKENLEG
ncbi:MAG: peptide deformylase [Alphaproteobacteria bacterium]